MCILRLVVLLAATCSVRSESQHSTSQVHLFSTLAQEYRNVSASVSGTIPDWLAGAVRISNGFGKHEGAGFELNFLFDIMPYINRWEIVSADEVRLTSRFLATEYLADSATKIPPYRTFGGTTPPMSRLEELATLTNLLSDNLNVNLIELADRLFAISDMAGEVEIDSVTLDTLGRPDDIGGIGSGLFDILTCAHPSQLPGDKWVYNYVAQIMGNFPDLSALNKFRFYRIDTTKTEITREPLIDIPVTNGALPYMHSFAHTPNYIVLFEFPLFWSIPDIIPSVLILPAMQWEPVNGTRIRVISKETWTVVREHWTKPFFAYHHINALERNGTVVADITTVPCDGSTGSASCAHMNAFELSTLREDSFYIPPNSVERFVVPVGPNDDGREVESSVITPTSFDLPTINERMRGSEYRYAYGTATHYQGSWWSSIVKVDMITGETVEWNEEDHYATEPNFVPRPGGVDEDDGVLLSTVLGGGERQRSYLLVLDAKTMQPLATAEAPGFLPYQSHGFARL